MSSSPQENARLTCLADQIRPDWEERLAAVKAAVARRANRRIIMRQVGDRLIPVGVTSSRTQLPEGITTVEVRISDTLFNHFLTNLSENRTLKRSAYSREVTLCLY